MVTSYSLAKTASLELFLCFPPFLFFFLLAAFDLFQFSDSSIIAQSPTLQLLPLMFIILDVLSEILAGSNEGILKSEGIGLLQSSNFAMSST